jgi:Leucine-rich repeat (LRR) protein
MKRFSTVLMLVILVVFASCEQPTMLSVSQTALTFENSGGNQSVTLTANKVWTASSNQGWLRVSPSSGEGTTTLSISCEGNTTYDSRTGNITIVSEELTLTISVTQAEGLGLLISQPEYNLSNEAQTISVTVQANVQYTVDIDNACRDWIKQESTKGLSSNTIKFAISKNESYDGREGKITIRQTNGNLSATVIVKQSQTNGLFAEKTEYEVSYEEQTLSIKVISNVDYDVQIDDSCKDWISRVQTKGLAESTLTLSISQNGKEERKGSVVLKYANLQVSITIKQASGFVVFEDDNFKAFCIENYDKNRDGEVSYDEINQVESLSVNTDNITSLQGIEFMPNLLNISAYASNNFSGKLSSLDVSKNTALISLHCYGNSLSSIDLSKNAKITSLSCIYNQLTSLDVSNNTALTSLSCSGNQLTNLDVSRNTALIDLTCDNNQLISLDVSKNTALTDLSCGYNQLTSLDVSNNTALTSLSCSGNHISSLDVSKNLSLVQLTCGSNNLSSLDISNNTALSWLWCDTNQLPILDVSKNTELTALHCLGNLITSLNVSNNDLIEYLNCTENPFLKVIWLKKEQRIKYLYYDKDVASITYVDEIISFKDTNFKAYCVENFDTDGDGEISFFEAASVNKIECMKRGISSLEGIRYFTELTYLDCGENRLTALDVKSNKALVTLICYNNELTSLSLSGIPSLMELHCGVNNITSLDLRGNTSLISINCQVNQLSSLDISECPSLKTLACNGNKLATLNVSNNTALSQLWCGSNPLTSLDVSKNTELTWLWFGSTPLTSLDVSNNTVLNYLWCYNNPFLTEIWLKTNQTIEDFQYDKDIATIKQ